MEEQPIQSAEEQLRAIGDMFDEYQEALSDGDWEKAGAIMSEIEEQVGQMP